MLDLAQSDNTTAIIGYVLGFAGLALSTTLTAWVAVRVHALAPKVEANTQAVARIEPQVDVVVAEVVEQPDGPPNLASKVTSIDNAVNNRATETPTLRETTEATAATVDRIEAEQVRIEGKAQAEDTAAVPGSGTADR